MALAGDWDGAKRFMIEMLGRSPGSATDSVREMRDFYELGEDTLWVTFFEGFLWWTFSGAVVIDLRKAPGEHGAVMRKARGWSKDSRLGQPLSVDLISTRLTKVAAYQRTICKIDDLSYLLRKINGEVEPSAQQGREALTALISAAEAMIPRLHERDFELMADLMLANLGWRRYSALGGSMPDVDLCVIQAATSERAFVQVKSRASQAVLDDYVMRFAASGLDRMFFVCHSPETDLIASDRRVHIWTNRELAVRVNMAGLFEWLIARVS